MRSGYGRDPVVWNMEGGSFANCLMAATVAAIISYIPIGNISSKFGRKNTILGGDIGKYTGTYYTFSMAAQIITPVLSGFLLENVSYRTLFPYAACFSTLAFVTMLQVRRGDVRPQKKESLLENFDVDD